MMAAVNMPCLDITEAVALLTAAVAAEDLTAKTRFQIDETGD
jgi:hypothetical protein